MKYTDIAFDQVRTWIRNKREHATKPASWEDLLLACKKNEDALVDFLESRTEEDDWPEMNVQDWREIVKQQKDAEEKTIRFAVESGAAIIHGDNQINTVSVSKNETSSWQSYKVFIGKQTA